MAMMVVIGIRPYPADVMVMSYLRCPMAVLETDDLLTILAELTVHPAIAVFGLLQPLDKGIEHPGMVAKIGRLDDVNLRVLRLVGIGGRIDLLDQPSGEQEIGEDDNVFKPQSMALPQAIGHQGGGDPAIAGLGPAKAHPLPEHPGDLTDIGIGV